MRRLEMRCADRDGWRVTVVEARGDASASRNALIKTDRRGFQRLIRQELPAFTFPIDLSLGTRRTASDEFGHGKTPVTRSSQEKIARNLLGRRPGGTLSPARSPSPGDVHRVRSFAHESRALSRAIRARRASPRLRARSGRTEFRAIFAKRRFAPDLARPRSAALAPACPR